MSIDELSKTYPSNRLSEYEVRLFKCPFCGHESHNNPAFAVKQGDNGRVFFYCHICKEKGGQKKLAQKIGFPERESSLIVAPKTPYTNNVTEVGNNMDRLVLQVWNDAQIRKPIDDYMHMRGIPAYAYQDLRGNVLRGGFCKYKLFQEGQSELVAQASVIYMLAATQMVRIPVDADFRKEHGKPMLGKLKQGEKACCWFGPMDSPNLAVFEGMENALSIRSLASFKTWRFAVTGTAGNLEKFTPDRHYNNIVVFADDDWKTRKPQNPGLTAAIKVSSRLGARICRPRRQEKIQDFNDLLKSGRLENFDEAVTWGADEPLVPELLDEDEEDISASYNAIEWDNRRYFGHTRDGNVPISNFLLLPQSVLQLPDGNEALDCIIKRHDGASKQVTLTVEELSDNAAFGKRVKQGKGWDYLWSGNQSQFISLLYYLHEQSLKLPTYILVDYWGRSSNSFLYDNAAISADEIEYLNENNNKASLGGDRYLVERQESPYGAAVKMRYEPSECDETRVEQVFTDYKKTGETALALGYGIASMFSDGTFRQFGAFPYLFIFGYKQTGKTTLARIIMGLFGYPYSLPPKSYKDSSLAGFTQGMEALSSVPFWLDEFSDKDKGRIPPEFLKNLYNRASTNKGSLQGSKSRPVRSTVIFSGQHISGDPAMRTRSVTLNLTTAELDKKQISWAISNWSQLIEYGARKIKQSLVKSKEARFLQAIQTWTDKATQKGVEHRIAYNHAAALAALDLFTGIDAQALFDNVVLAMMKSFEDEMEELSPINAFFQAVINVWTRCEEGVGSGSQIKEAILKCLWVKKESKQVFCRLQELYSTLSKENEELDPLSSLRGNLVSEHNAVKGQFKHDKQNKHFRGTFAIRFQDLTETMEDCYRLVCDLYIPSQESFS